jgi:hypothetical protein
MAAWEDSCAVSSSMSRIRGRRCRIGWRGALGGGWRGRLGGGGVVWGGGGRRVILGTGGKIVCGNGECCGELVLEYGGRLIESVS